MTTIYYNNQHLQVHIKESQLFGGINWGWIDLTDSKGFQYTNATIMPYWIETANKLDLIDELETLYAIQGFIMRIEVYIIPIFVLISVIALAIIIYKEEKLAHIKDDELEELNEDVSIYIDKQWLKDKQSEWNDMYIKDKTQSVNKDKESYNE